MSEHFTRPNIQKVVGTLGTTPEQRGLSTQEFKDKFDEFPDALQQYIRETLLTELDAFKQEFIQEQEALATHQAEFLAQVPFGEMYTATLENGWTGSLNYRKNGMGLIHLYGTLTSGTAGARTIIATLPSGYAPTSVVIIHAHNLSYGRMDFVGFLRNDGSLQVDRNHDEQYEVISKGVNFRLDVLYSAV